MVLLGLDTSPYYKDKCFKETDSHWRPKSPLTMSHDSPKISEKRLISTQRGFYMLISYYFGSFWLFIEVVWSYIPFWCRRLYSLILRASAFKHYQLKTIYIALKQLEWDKHNKLLRPSVKSKQLIRVKNGVWLLRHFAMLHYGKTAFRLIFCSTL